MPGKLTVIGVCADEPAGKPIAACTKRVVWLTLHRGATDDQLLRLKGAAAFWQARIPDLCQEALSQGVLLTREDLGVSSFWSPLALSSSITSNIHVLQFYEFQS